MKRVIIFLIGICVFYYSLKINSFDLLNTFSKSSEILNIISIKNILICLLFYFIGIIGRAMRLFYLSGKIDISIRELLICKH